MGRAVLGMAIDKYCYLSVRHLPPFFQHKHRIIYSQIESVGKISEINHPAVRAVFSEMGVDRGLEVHHDADLPARSGLGSSSAFTVGLLYALYALQGKMIAKPHWGGGYSDRARCDRRVRWLSRSAMWQRMAASIEWIFIRMEPSQ